MLEGTSYQVVREIGAGGMGVVYEIEHVRLKKRYVAKVIHETIKNDESAKKRMEREAQVLDQLETQSGAYTFRSFWMGPSGVCSVMDNVADGTSRTGCSAVVYSATAGATTWSEFGQTSVQRSYVAGVAGTAARGRKITVGPTNNCVIFGASTAPGSAGQVACSGENWGGVSLGIPSVGNTVFGAGVIAGLINIVDISVSTDANFTLNGDGGGFTCAVEGPGADQGKVKCWGYNLSGQLGNGQTTVPPTYGASSPVVATGISTATAVSAGARHTCAVLATGKVSIL